MHARPDEVRLILVDLKRVELAPYDGLPHLLQHVIVEPHEAKAALNWAVHEMEERYKLLASHTVRNIGGLQREGRRRRAAAVRRPDHRRAGRPDHARGPQGRGSGRQDRPEGAGRRHPPRARHPAPERQRRDRPDQGQRAEPDRLRDGLERRQPDGPRPARRRGPDRPRRHALPAGRPAAAGPDAGRVRERPRGRRGRRALEAPGARAVLRRVAVRSSSTATRAATAASSAGWPRWPRTTWWSRAAELVTTTRRRARRCSRPSSRSGFSRASRLMDELERYGIIGPQDLRNPAVAADRLRPGQLAAQPRRHRRPGRLTAGPEGRSTREGILGADDPAARRLAPTIRTHLHDMTTRDEARRRIARRPRGTGRDRRRSRPSPSPACPSACWPPARRRASTSTGPSATRRSGRATSARSSAATTASCPARSTRRASCATTRSTSGLDPDEILAPVAPGARRRRRPERARRSTSRSRSRRRARASRSRSGCFVAAVADWSCVVLFVGYLGLQLVRFSRPPEVAVTDPIDRRVDGRGDRDDATPCAARRCPARWCRSPSRAATSRSGPPPAPAGRGRPTSSCAAGGTSSASAPPTPTPARTSRSRSRSSSPSRSRTCSRRP